MADTGENPDPSGVIEHVKRALSHAEEALRCYLALCAAEAERRVRSLLRQAVWTMVLAGCGLIGVGLLACGVAMYVESRAAVPGAGPMAVGGAMLVVVLAVIAIRRAGRGK